MLIAAVAMATMLGWAPDDGPGPEELVARLGAPRYADRETAAEALRQMGDRALPALRKARSARDLEIRGRASKLRDEIESLTILEPTMVRLDFHDRPLSEVVEEISRRARVSIAPLDQPSIYRKPGDGPSWPDRRITLESPDPLPFWEAIDRLCRAGGLRRMFPQQFYGPDEPFDRLTLVPGAASPPKVDVGPFRIELLRICRERGLNLAPGLSQFGREALVFGPASKPTGASSGPEIKELRALTFFAELLISPEPRLRIIGQASLENLKATDGRGNSVLRELTADQRRAETELFRNNPHLDPKRHPELRFGSGSQSSPTQIRVIPMADSTPTGTRLAEFKGIVAVAVMARRADPLVVPLSDVTPRTIEDDGVRLTIHEVEVKPGHFNGELEFTLETEKPGESLKVHGPGIGPLPVHRPYDLIQREIEIRDDQDRLFAWSFLRAPSEGVRGRMKLQVRSPNQGERLDFSRLKLRVFTMVGAAMEVPFSFAGVTMP